MLRILPFFLATFLVGCPVLYAANYEFKAGGLSLWLPDDWGIDLTAKTMTGFSAGRDTLLKLSLITDAGNLHAAFLKYSQMLRPEISAYRETQSRSAAAIAGIEGLSAGGEGRANGAKQ
jgi:hypothetical protein